VADASAAGFDPGEAWDNLHGPSRADVHWATDNVGEAVPGVVSPLGASIWTSLGERAFRGSYVEIGAFARSEGAVPERREDRLVGVFCGRLAIQVEVMTLLGDRLPGVSGQDIAASALGTVPDDIAYRPTMRRYPLIAWKLPAAFLSMPRRLRTDPPRVHGWWQHSIAQLRSADLARARATLADALVEFEKALSLQITSVFASSQLMHEALTRLIDRAGVGDLGALSGTGGAEMAVITDIWRASRGEMPLGDVVRNHGFHGPLEGEVSSVVWREDVTPLERMIDAYARLGEEADPGRREAQARAELAERQAEVLAALPRAQRPAAKLVLELASQRIPLRGVAKRSFLQGIDVIRASARRIGTELVAAGEIESAEDAFYLTADELTGPMPAGARELVARRTARREQYQGVAIPGGWKGQVIPIVIGEADRTIARSQLVSGVGVSGGTVEGLARVVTDPAFGEIEPGEILVAPTTDPGWAPIMFLSAALVVDIGGPISHAAVVARELRMPCVVNTRTGTRELRTGDRVRVNGDAGTVEILARTCGPGAR
jgi:phosphohistidine swiveling domain-containing protein